MSTLNTQTNLTQPDVFYQALVDLHRDMNDAQSRQINAKLILLLANHIGDMAVLQQAMHIAKQDV